MKKTAWTVVKLNLAAAMAMSLSGQIWAQGTPSQDITTSAGVSIRPSHATTGYSTGSYPSGTGPMLIRAMPNSSISPTKDSTLSIQNKVGDISLILKQPTTQPASLGIFSIFKETSTTPESILDVIPGSSYDLMNIHADTTINGQLTVNGVISSSGVNIGDGSVVLGQSQAYNSGDFSFASGYYSSATGIAAFAGGLGNGDDGYVTASGRTAFAYGEKIWASGDYSFAFGRAQDSYSYAASEGDYSFSFGAFHWVQGDYAATFGLQNTLSGNHAFGQGEYHNISSLHGVAFGYGIAIQDAFAHVLGRFNADVPPSDTTNRTTAWKNDSALLVLGNGTGFSQRSNALVVRKNGDTDINGKLKVQGDAQFDGTLILPHPAGGIAVAEEFE